MAVTHRHVWRGWVSRLRPPSTLSVGVGFLVSGASAYAFLALAARALGPTRYGPLAAFWAFTFLAGPGLFSVCEKELTRRISSGLALDAATGRTTRQVSRIGMTFCLILSLLAASAAHFYRVELFDGSWFLYVSLLISFPAICLQYLAEGVVLGNRRFHPYAIIISGEGLIRLSICLLLIALGVKSAGEFGLAIAVAPVVSVVPVLGVMRKCVRGGVPVATTVMLRSVAWMVGGALGLSVMVNAGTLVVKALGGTGQSALTGRFLSGMVIVRVPLYLYNSAAVTALPALSAEAAAGHWAAFFRRLNRMVVAVTAIGLLTTLAAGLFGPSVISVVFGHAYRLPGPDLALLAASAGALLVATTLTVAMQAVGHERLLCLSWGVAVSTFATVVALVHPLLQRIEMGMLLGSLAACVVMLTVVYLSLGYRLPSLGSSASVGGRGAT
jgi:O-antigen/teichoic acid export membrane protein